eukprot:549201-Pelagomonas_calceolata.AAC.1
MPAPVHTTILIKATVVHIGARLTLTLLLHWACLVAHSIPMTTSSCPCGSAQTLLTQLPCLCCIARRHTSAGQLRARPRQLSLRGRNSAAGVMGALQGRCTQRLSQGCFTVAWVLK